MTTCRRIIALIDTLNEWIGKSVAWLTLAMVLVTFIVVILRYAFNLGWIALQESVNYMYAVLFMLGTGYTLKHDAHVRVDIFYQRLSPAHRAWVDLIGTLLLLLPVTLFILWSSWSYVSASWAITEPSSQTGGLPGLFLIKSTIPLMAALLLLQGLSMALRSLLIILGSSDHTGQQI